MARFKNDWNDKSRQEKHAAILYPSHSTDETRAEMAKLAREGEGKRAPHQQPLLNDAERGCVSRLGGQAKWSK